ncbi:MAG: hypothetical protein NPIRA02_07980 [Nitrospirales bacterium]|nr:MAG: hypothetical protein NPIRA02_07980 [Nitrospirales bacterium]
MFGRLFLRIDDPYDNFTDLVNVTNLWSLLTDHHLLTSSPQKPGFSRVPVLIVCAGILLLAGCPADNTATLKQENLQLRKQVDKLESVVSSLQDGNKAIQQQIDLLNREARAMQEQHKQELKEKEETITNLSTGNTKDSTQLQALKQENTKLRGDASWLRTQRKQWRNGLRVRQHGGQSESLNYPFPAVDAVIASALTGNGYTILASMKTDQKAVYITSRKTSPPASLEVTGFRNQYILSVDKHTAHDSQVWVKADFEKLSQRGQLLDASKLEIKEIEGRLIKEIQEHLTKPKPPSPKK